MNRREKFLKSGAMTGKLITIAIIVVIVLALIVGVGIWRGQKVVVTEEVSWGSQKITYGDKVITAADLPPMRVSEGAVFEGQGEIRTVLFSPNNKKAAFVVTGVHEFGWVYDFELEKLIPLAFQYGGGVDIVQWQKENIIELDITTPKPTKHKKVIDLNNLPEYPKLEL